MGPKQAICAVWCALRKITFAMCDACSLRFALSSQVVFLCLNLLLGAEIWEGDERRTFQLLEPGDSLNGRNLFTELPFLWNSLPMPSFTECLDPIQ